MKRVISEFKIVICPTCQGSGKLSHYDRDRERNKIIIVPCDLCLGSGRVNRRVIAEYSGFLIDVV